MGFLLNVLLALAISLFFAKSNNAPQLIQYVTFDLLADVESRGHSNFNGDANFIWIVNYCMTYTCDDLRCVGDDRRHSEPGGARSHGSFGEIEKGHLC